MHSLSKMLSIAALALVPWLQVSASELEVLHWWTSKGEQRALAELKKDVKDKGYNWVNFAITGGGGDNALKVLRSRIISGNPPAAAHIKGETVQEWANLGLLHDIDQVAKEDNWDALIPTELQSKLKAENKYYAAPMGLHRTNWMWVNPEPFQRIHQPVPNNLSEFLHTAPKLKKAGIMPLAMGQQDWQYGPLFEAVLLDTTSVDFYRKSMVDLNEQSYQSRKMLKVFEVLADIRSLLPSPIIRQSWDQATLQVMEGQAAVQINGDWIKGEFTAAGKTLDKDILCIPVSGTESAFIYNMDSLVMFSNADPKQQQSQSDFAKTAMDADLQQRFSLNKGSIPVRQDIDLTSFDVCSQKSIFAFNDSIKNNRLLPSMAESMATSERVKKSIFRVLEHFFEHPEVTPEEARQQLATAIRAST
ncbi:hypothetical protein ACH42_12095 [Endozoicomonas sp. (ex Bugula neritina AB1)]|nr:hypothetical protein ACH42_12095 [Endozoicomonas sp. (ex Bugula neritina AB1)]